MGAELVALSGELRRYRYRIVVAAAAFADSPEWILDGPVTGHLDHTAVALGRGVRRPT